MKKKLTAIVLAIVSLLSMCLLASCGEQKKVVYAEIALSAESYGYCVDPANTELLASVNELIAELKSNGKLDELLKAEKDGTATHIGEVKTASQNRANELVVATNAEFAPFEYKKGTYFAGVDMQVAKLLAEKLGKELVIVNMKFEAVILSVGNGSCDIGMAGLTISEGREENVTFSDAYYTEAMQYIAYVEGDETFASCKTKEEIENAIKGLKNVKAGAAAGQTGELYLKGSADFDFAGYSNIEVKSYDSIALAVRDLANGNIRFVVGDADTLKAAVNGING